MATKRSKVRKQTRGFFYPQAVVFGVLSSLEAIRLMLNVLARNQPEPADPGHRLGVLATKAAIGDIVAGIKEAQLLLQR